MPTLLLLLLLAIVAGPAGAQARSAAAPQYVFLNRAPGMGFNQNDPESVTDALFAEPMDAVATGGTPARRLGLSFIFSYLDGPPEKMEATLRRLLAMAQKRRTPVLVVLDGQNWWGYRSDLWDWWDPARPGYDRKNAANVEWTDWGAEHAVKIAWRNWGRQIRVLPPPNLASPAFREASQRELTRLARVIKAWADRLPAEDRYLFPGVKIGWEASIGVNAYYYPDGNSLLERYPDDPSHDPQTGLNTPAGFSSGLPALGYAAMTAKGWRHPGAITREDQDRVVSDYLAFLAGICRRVGLPRDKVFTHAGGQFGPWELHSSYSVAVNRDSYPGWSFYNLFPEQAGDLSASLDAAHLQDWCAAEWLPAARTADEWRAAIDRTLAFRRCHFLSVYNWEGIRGNAAALDGVRRSLQ